MSSEISYQLPVVTHRLARADSSGIVEPTTSSSISC